MSSNIRQIFIANPSTSNASTDLLYIGKSPYGVGDDSAISYANFAAQFGAPYSAAALTRVSDTNIVLTLSANASNSLLAATSITASWSGTLALARGGLAAALTASNGGIFYSTASAGAILAGTATANLPLLSGSSAAPTWGSFALSLGGAMTTAGAHTLSGAFASTFTFTNTTTVTFPTSGTLATTSQLNFVTWNDVSGTTQAAAVNNGYIISNASQTTVTLPSTAAEGSVIAVQGKGAAGWILTAAASQTIHLGSSVTSTAGSITSTNQWDSIQLVCVTANTVWACTSVIGNLTLT